MQQQQQQQQQHQRNGRMLRRLSSTMKRSSASASSGAGATRTSRRCRLDIQTMQTMPQSPIRGWNNPSDYEATFQIPKFYQYQQHSTIATTNNDDGILLDIPNDNENPVTAATLGKKLLSYSSLHEAYQDRNIPIEQTNPIPMNQPLIKDVYMVMRHCLLHIQNNNYNNYANDDYNHSANDTSLSNQQGAKLSVEFGQLIHRLVLPDVNKIVPSNLLQPVLDMGLATLRLYRKEAKRLTFQEVESATELFDKLQSIQVYLDGDNHHHSSEIDRYQNTIQLALNQLLGCYSEWSSSRWRSFDEAKTVLQQAEQLLLREKPNAPEQFLARVTPDLNSFLEILGAWGRIDRNRAKEILTLITELCHDNVLVESPIILETYLSTAFHDSSHTQEAIQLVQDMANQYIADPENHTSKPRVATLVKLCGLFHHDAATITQNVKQLNIIADSLDLPFNHILVNAVVSAYSMAKCTSSEQKLNLCEHMMESLETARESVHWSEDQLPITYGVAIRAWAECARGMNVSKEYTDVAAQQAKLLWDNAIVENVPLDIMAHNHVLRTQKFSPRQASEIFEYIRKQTTVQPDLWSWTLLFAAYEHGTETFEEAEQAEAYLGQMIALRRHQRPNRFIFNSVICAWTSLPTLLAVERAHSILDRLCAEYESQLQVLKNDPYRANVQAKPLNDSFQHVVQGYACYGNARHLDIVMNLVRRMIQLEYARIEAPSHMKRYMSSVKLNAQILGRVREMYEEHYQGDEDIEKMLQSLRSIVLKVEAFETILNSNSHNKVKEIVEAMEQRLAVLPPSATNDRLVVCNVALDYIAEASEGQKSTNAAEKILVQMGRSGVMPDRVTYSNVMKAWTKIGSFPAIARAEEHLMTLVALNLDAANGGETKVIHPSRQLDAKCFNVVMNAYSKLKTNEGNDRVRQLYALMDSVSHSLPYLVPDNNSIRTMFESAPVELADRILRELIIQGERNGTLLPVAFFASALNKWATSGHQAAGERAEQVLRLQESYSKHDANTAVSTISFNVVMKAISNTLPVYAEQVENLLEELWHRYESERNQMLKPDLITYNTAMNSYQRRGNEGDVEKCLSILDRMMDRRIAPNVASICICMDALRNSTRPDRVEKTVALLNLYQDKYNRENAPTPNMFRLALKVLDATEGDPSYVLLALELFRKAAITGSLTPHSFALTINLCNKYTADPKTRLATVKKIMHRCKEAGMISSSSLDSFRDAVPTEVFRDVLKIPRTVDTSIVQVENLPHSWSRPMDPADQRLLFRQVKYVETAQRVPHDHGLQHLHRVDSNILKSDVPPNVIDVEDDVAFALYKLVKSEASDNLTQGISIFQEAMAANSLTSSCVAAMICLAQPNEQIVRAVLLQCLGMGLLSTQVLDSLRASDVPVDMLREVLHIPRRVPMENVHVHDLPLEWRNGRGLGDRVDFISCWKDGDMMKTSDDNKAN